MRTAKTTAGYSPRASTRHDEPLVKAAVLLFGSARPILRVGRGYWGVAAPPRGFIAIRQGLSGPPGSEGWRCGGGGNAKLREANA